jgi:hypothetical protein
MLTGPDFGLVRTAMLPKLQAFWVMRVTGVSDNRGAIILLSLEEGDTAVLRNSLNAHDILEDANLQDMRRQIVADTW